MHKLLRVQVYLGQSQMLLKAHQAKRNLKSTVIDNAYGPSWSRDLQKYFIAPGVSDGCNSFDIVSVCVLPLSRPN